MEGFSSIKICEGTCKRTNSGEACCIANIYSLLKDHAKELKDMEEAKFAETPLHRAATAGNTEVALEILSLMPSLGRKLDWGGSSPLHLAIEGAHRDTASSMAEFDRMLVRVKGKNGMTPLMLCAARAGYYDNIDDDEEQRLLAQLLTVCPESVSDVNNLNQTLVHVALVNQGCKTVCMLVEWLRRRNQVSSVLSVKDLNGNTALHAAAQFGCVRGAEKIVKLVKLNKLNSEKKTALDLAIKHNQSRVRQILEEKGAKKSDDIRELTTTDYVLSDSTLSEAFSRTYYYLTEELTLELRSAILVVATLIVAATYQAVLQPPGGLYPPNEPKTTPGTLVSHPRPTMGRRLLLAGDDDTLKSLAGLMVMEKEKYRYFMPCNTFSFALSVVIMIFVVPGSPVFLILHLCLVFMCISYLLALDAISHYTGISDMIYGLSLYVIVGAYIAKLLYYPVKALLIDEDWWLQGLSVKVSNCHSVAKWFYTNTAIRMKKQHRVLLLN